MQLVPLALFLGRIGPNCPVGPRLRAGPPALTHAIPRESISAFMLSSKHLTIARLPPHLSTRHLAPNLAIIDEFGQRPLGCQLISGGPFSVTNRLQRFNHREVAHQRCRARCFGKL